jgi:xyloglucan:xyloglucosyl transferase
MAGMMLLSSATIKVARAARMWMPAAALVLMCCAMMMKGSVGQGTITTFQESAYSSQFQVVWQPNNVWVSNQGQVLELLVTQQSGTALQSLNSYLFGSFRVDLKLVPNDSAGVLTSFYLSSAGDHHDEVDFEFLGNSTGQPYVLQTNIFAAGVGGREQRINLWFDPRADFHTYSVIWNPTAITLYIDNVLIRVFQNHEAQGQAYPNAQGMNVYSSVFDASSWATQGGLVPIDFSQAPFVSSYTNFGMDSCIFDATNPTACSYPQAGTWWNAQEYQSIPTNRIGQLQWVQADYMIYNYCTDNARYPTPPFECTAPLY